ncbi:hypothetical protein FOZ61_010953 [Perkinsus olseni]|uniref:UDP-glucose glycoprotein glucosyltransferase n=1 Tax=Perkinsus olseni TaxID=32597 RepID=A0A7J6M1H5_PEROL|nr:hypothetical protein FOZ61_010953 [Perkinsus olseni]
MLIVLSSFLTLFYHCAHLSSAHTVSVSLQSPWPAVAPASQELEFLSHLSGDQARQYLLSDKTAESLLTTRSVKSLMKFTVLNKYFSPMVEYHRSFARVVGRGCQEEALVVVEVAGEGLKEGCLSKGVCVVTKAGNSSTEDFGVEVQEGAAGGTTVLVYGEAKSLTTTAALRSLTTGCCIDCRVVFRHGDGPGDFTVQPRELISGYGAGLTIKNSEYKASADEGEDVEAAGSAHQGTGCGEVGVCWTRLQERFPEVDFTRAKANLKSEKILSSADRKLKAWELTSIGAQLLEAARGDLPRMVKMLEDFPARVVELSQATVAKGVEEQVSEVAQGLTQSGSVYVLGSGDVIDEKMVTLHPLIDKLLPIYLAVEELAGLGLEESEAARMVRNATRLPMASRMEWKGDGGVGPVYVYNVLRDPQASRWSEELDVLVQMMIMGQRGIAPLRRVVFDIIFLIDLADRQQVLETVGKLLVQPFPARIALVPSTATQAGARAAECFSELYGSGRKKELKKVRQFLQALVRAANSEEDEVLSVDAIERVCEDVLLEALPPSGGEVSQVVKKGQAWAAAKGLPFPSVVVNGRVSGDLGDMALFINEDFGALGTAWYTKLVEKQKKENKGEEEVDWDSEEDDDGEVTDVIRELIFPEKSVDFLSSVYHPALFDDDLADLVRLPIEALRRVTNLEAPTTSEGPAAPLHVLVAVGGGLEELEEKLVIVKRMAEVLEGRPGTIFTVIATNPEVNARLLGCAHTLEALRNFKNSKCSKMSAVGPDVEEAAARLARSARAENSRGVVLVMNGRRTELDVAEAKPILDDLLDSLLAPFAVRQTAQQVECGGLDSLACTVALSLMQTVAASENPHREMMEEGLEKAFEKAPLAGFNLAARGHMIAEIVASVDPLTDAGRSALSTISHMSAALDGFGARLVLAPQEKYSEYPLKGWHRTVMATGVAEEAAAAWAEFNLTPTRNTLTLGLEVLPNWQVSSLRGEADMDNIRLTPVDPERVEAQYVLKQLYIEGQSYDVDENGHPRGPADGAQLQLVAQDQPLAETWVMRNLGYYQLYANPGRYDIRLKPNTVGESVYEAMGANVVHVNKFLMPAYPVKLRLRPGKARELIYEQQEDDKSDDGPIHIFTVASGHLYEQLLAIMVLSVRNHTTSRLCFWFIDQFLSPQFREFIPRLADEYDFEYRFVTYKWPSWLNPQSEKQRLIWAYKILFLDVIFPPSVDRIIFIDADQVVRADVRELWDMDLGGKVYGFTPMGDTNPSTEGFRFWKQGYWKNHLAGRPYHISALFVVDLAKFRKTGAGDTLRAVYNQLSQDPASLANLDQDLPNYAQHQIPIHSLPADWLWCETWCGEEAKETAKTIDLCQNPLTKEPKTDMARRIIPEWADYWGQVQELITKVKAERDEEA